jgi:hypothetical protein
MELIGQFHETDPESNETGGLQAATGEASRLLHRAVMPRCLAVAPDFRLGLNAAGTGEPTMQSWESAPLWVWLTLALITGGSVLYVAGYFVIEDILAYFK